METISLLKAFHLQRRGAGYRGIPFELTFKQWLKIWVDSGRLNERGRLGHQYVMGRKGDKGPYSLRNVIIITQAQNIGDGHRNWNPSKEVRQRMSEGQLRRGPRSEDYCAKLSAVLTGKPKSSEHRAALSAATRLAQARMRAEGRRIGRPPKQLETYGE